MIMKVFISGTKVINKFVKDLPDQVKGYLDKLMAEENEILIGDCWGTDTCVQEYLSRSGYKSVTVYVSGSKDRTRINAGKWEEKHVRADGKTPYVFRVEKDFHMAEDSDFGLAIWDEESKGTYINMLCLAFWGKETLLYLIKEQEWLTIRSLEDLRAFAGKPGEIGAEDIGEALRNCGFSEEMTEYLVTENAITPYQLSDVIFKAPISLDEKMGLLGRLGTRQNLKYDAFCSVESNIKQGRTYKAIKHDIRALAEHREHDTIWSYIRAVHDEIREA